MEHLKNLPDQRRLRLALVVNTVAPYRLPIYAALAETFDTLILHGGNEANRAWSIQVEEPLRERKVWTIQLRLKKRLGLTDFPDTRYFHFNFGLLWELPRFRPDIIISNEMGLRTLISHAYARLMGKSHWVWWGGTLHSERKISPLKKIYRRILARLMKRWISYGATSTEYLESLGVPSQRILQIQNCVPHATFLTAPCEGQQPLLPDVPRPILLAVGQLIARKGLDTLVEACGRLIQQGRTFSLVLVGNGPDKERLQQRAAVLGIRNFHLLPNQSQSALSRLYREAQVFVFPTYEDVWGLVVNEAIWAGVPVLCSQYAGCAPEIVPAENIFDPTDPKSFDAALANIFLGRVKPSDRTRLMTCSQASDLITRSITSGAPVKA